MICCNTPETDTNTRIRIVDNLHQIDEFGKRQDVCGINTPEEILLDSKHINFETLFAEVLHVLNNYLSLKPSPSLEFQEHVLKDLYNIQNLMKNGYISNNGSGISTSNSKSYIDFIKSVFCDNGVLDLNKFLMDIEPFYNEFKEKFKESNSYQEQGIENYNYNWEDLLNILGIQYQ